MSDSLTILDNILNTYENYTYHFRLFSIDETLAGKNSMDISNLPKIIIAESGAGSFYIDDVEIATNTSAGGLDQTGFTAIDINFTIVEPLGVSFYDRLVNAGKVNGVDDIVKMPLYLELSFLGHDTTGALKTVADKTRTWKIAIINLNADVKTSGSTYQISAKSLARMAGAEDYSIPAQIQSTASGGSFIEYFNSIASSWNALAKKDSDLHATALTQYKFVFYD